MKKNILKVRKFGIIWCLSTQQDKDFDNGTTSDDSSDDDSSDDDLSDNEIYEEYAKVFLRAKPNQRLRNYNTFQLNHCN